MTYNVFGGTLNLTQSINLSVCIFIAIILHHTQVFIKFINDNFT